MNKSEKDNLSAKIQINWLACIYDDYHLNPYKMGTFKKWDLASLKKKKKKLKNRLKYTLFWEGLESGL